MDNTPAGLVKEANRTERSRLLVSALQRLNIIYNTRAVYREGLVPMLEKK